jgi:hypothetical protein
MQVGPDFLVHRLIVLRRSGTESGGILIYVGHHPDYQPAAKRGEGMMFGKKVEWHALAEGEGTQALLELPIPGAERLMAHVIVRAPNDARLKELREAAETMSGQAPGLDPEMSAWILVSVRLA